MRLGLTVCWLRSTTGRRSRPLPLSRRTALTGFVLACRGNAMRVPSDVLLDLRYGGDAADFTQLANKDHLDATQVELHRIQVILKEYHKTLFYMRERDERMRQTTESTSTRLVMFSLMNAGIVIAAAGLQILYYRRVRFVQQQPTTLHGVSYRSFASSSAAACSNKDCCNLHCPKCDFVMNSFCPFCPSCDSLQPEKPRDCPTDYFCLLNQPHKYSIDTTEGADPEVAAADSAMVNDAIKVLRSPLKRAEHLLQLETGVKADDDEADGMGNMDPSVLMEMLEYNEEIDDAEGDEKEMLKLTQENDDRIKECEDELTRLCDEARDWEAVETEVNRLRFLVRIDDRLKGTVNKM
ncbi:hypothetical protein FOZ60_015266 [Perkinsus olseni]|uniref:GOLD domain-containing protein n=1 Tax=Perkinsus olseni TaxID=32597 RepID=A0A7J6P602_PEROL|nr:hypothetical protein FOZ60_015266 [Perkinsus olseni]